MKKNKAGVYINNVDDAMLEYYRVFAKKLKPLPPEPQLSDFYHPSEAPKYGELLFLQLVQALQHMPYINTLNKWQKKRNYIKNTISPIIFGQVERQ